MSTLVMACCGNKIATPEREKAIQVYQSRAFGLVREELADRFEVLILSAKYGLIPAAHEIEAYDEKMTAKRSRDLIEWCAPLYVPLWLETSSEPVYVYGGELYRAVVRAWCLRAHRECIEVVGRGRGCGDHFSALKALVPNA